MFMRKPLLGVSGVAMMAPADEGGGSAPPASDTAAAPAAEAPAAEGAPAEAGAAEGGESGGEGEGDSAAAGGEEQPAKPTRIPWQNKRIDRLTAENKQERERREQAEREAQEARERLAAYEALYGKDGTPAAPTSPVAPAAPPADGRTYTRAELEAEAARIAQINLLNQRCDTLFETGAKTHDKTWGARVQAAGQAFGEELRGRVDFFEALTSLPNGADVYHELAGDLDHMADVLAMPPLKLGMELAAISTRLSAKPKGPRVSAAPAPIAPLDGNNPQDDAPLDKVDMREYERRRMAQREERYRTRGY